MKQHALVVGLHLLFKQTNYKIIQKIEAKLTLQKLDDSSLLIVDEKDLLLALTNNDLVIHGREAKSNKQLIETTNFNCLSSLPVEEMNEVILRFKFVKQAILTLGEWPTTAGLADAIKQTEEVTLGHKKPSEHSVYRWWKKYINSGNDILCLARKPSGKAGGSSFCEKVTNELLDVIESDYLDDTRPPISHVYQLFLNRMDYLNVGRLEPYKFPSRSQFYRIIQQLDQYEVTKARFGRRKADDIFRIVGKGPITKRILERVEVDHTKLDIFVIDEATNEVIGRPTITVIMDCWSRMVLGLYIGFEPPSLVSVMRALKQAILPKDMSSSLFEGVTNDWPAYGIPMRLICDNGSEFHAKTFFAMCAELGIDLQFCPRGSGSSKGTVERFMGRINREVCHLIPGTSFESINKRDEYDSAKHAVATEDELIGFIYRWLIDVYSHEINKNTMRTPHDLWIEGLQQISPVLPESETVLSFCMTDEYKRTLTFKGIEIFNMFYQSTELKEMRHRKSTSFSVTVRADQEDISHIWVLDTASNTYVKVPSIESEYTDGLSLRQHRHIRGIQAKKGVAGRDAKATREHRAALSADIGRLKHSKKIRKTQKAAQVSQKGQATLNSLTSSNTNKVKVSKAPEILELRTFDVEEL